MRLQIFLDPNVNSGAEKRLTDALVETALVAVRRAVPADLETIVELCGERPYPALTLRGQTTEQRRQAMKLGFVRSWDNLDKEPRLTLLVNDQGDGFLAMFTNLMESISGDPQSVIQDLYARTPEQLTELLDAAEARALETDGEFTVIDVAVGETALEETLAARGYQVEMFRIMRAVHKMPTREPRYRIRPARQTDQLFIVWLSGQTGLNTVVPGRSADGETVAVRFFASYMGQSFVHDPRIRAYIAEDLSDPDNVVQAGYILLKLGFEDLVDKQHMAYIYDIAVRPEYWGKRVVHDLMDQADRYMVENRITLLQGDISRTNERALRTSVKALGFQIEWQRWSKKLT